MEEGKKYRQFLTGLIVNLASVALGTTLGWTSPVQPKLVDENLEDTPLAEVATADETAWIGSILALGALVAPFAAGPLADKFGRKIILLSSTLFFVASWILLVTTNNVPQIYAARLLQGFGVGFVMTVQTMYIGEIASDDCRGALGSFMQLFIVIGILYVYAIGPYVSYVALQWICCAVPVLFAVTFFFMPETPHYYIAKGRKEAAVDSLRFLRGKSADGVQDELTSITNSVEESMRNKATFKDLFSNAGNVKALIICAGLISFQQLSGINMVLFYSTKIFKDTGSSMEPAIATILVGTVQVVASGCTPLVVDRLGRKPILLVSAGGMAVSLGTLGLYFYFAKFDPEVAETIQWLPVTSLIFFVTVYCIGFGPLPWAVLGEMFPPNIKSVASSVVASTCWILGFVVLKWAGTLDEAVGQHWTFWIFGIFCALAFTFTLTTVMETKGMSLQQIQDKLNSKSA